MRRDNLCLADNSKALYKVDLPFEVKVSPERFVDYSFIHGFFEALPIEKQPVVNKEWPLQHPGPVPMLSGHERNWDKSK